jgi:hypothetical protein
MNADGTNSTSAPRSLGALNSQGNMLCHNTWRVQGPTGVPVTTTSPCPASVLSVADGTIRDAHVEEMLAVRGHDRALSNDDDVGNAQTLVR